MTALEMFACELSDTAQVVRDFVAWQDMSEKLAQERSHLSRTAYGRFKDYGERLDQIAAVRPDLVGPWTLVKDAQFPGDSTVYHRVAGGLVLKRVETYTGEHYEIVA